jgi:hypothetical protein
MTTMPNSPLDDLKLAWKELSLKLERQNALSLHHLKQEKLARFQSGLRPLVYGQLVQLGIGILVVVFFARFSIQHMANTHLLVCGTLLAAYGVMFIAFATRDLALIRQIDYAAPVVAIQKALAELRAWHVRAAAWYGLTGSVVWLPVMIVILYLLGADFWIDKPQKIYWLISTAVVCLAANVGLMLLVRSSGKYGQWLRESWIGRSVNRAQAVLTEIEEFEREVPAIR